MEKQQIFTTKELAKYIKLNEKTIIKMAQNGELPGRKIGNQWRFHEAVIDAYLQKKIISSSDDQISGMLKNQLPVVQLSRLLDRKAIDLDCKSGNALQILKHLSKMAVENALTVSAEELYTELKKREDLLSTALGGQIAVPHPRHPSKKLFRQPGLVIVYCAKGIDFNAPDGQKVKLFLMIAAPDEAAHLKILANIAKMLNNLDVLNLIAKTKDADDLIRVLIGFDQKNIFKGL